MINNDQLQSETISYLRFPLIAVVVLAHSSIALYTIQGENVGAEVTFPVYENIGYYITWVFGQIVIPTFYFISGFLFFLNVQEWNVNMYGAKLKSRFYSLVIPYLFWNLLALALFFIAENMPFISGLFSGDYMKIKDYGIKEFLMAFWVKEGGVALSPFVYPLWFVRDLIVIVVMTPLVYWTIRYLKIFGLAVLFALWYLDVFNIAGLNTAGLFFFSAGAYFGLHKINLTTFFNKMYYLSMLYPALSLIDLATRYHEFNKHIHYIGIIVGVIFLFNVVSSGIRRGKLHVSVFLANAGFFVYVTHEPWLLLIKKLSFSVFRPSSEISYILLFLIPALFIIGLSLSVYYLMNKYMPRVLKVIDGGR
ncbi:MAG: acyltransferase [Prevotella sp.]|jgi:hypothetical protein|nr:acyltransferase [Prevotella sp.]